MAIKNKKGQVVGNMPVAIRILLIILGTIVFFAMYPAISGIIEGVTATLTNDVIIFLVNITPYVILIGLFYWILKGEA